MDPHFPGSVAQRPLQRLRVSRKVDSGQTTQACGSCQFPVGYEEGDPDRGQEKLAVTDERVCLPSCKVFLDNAHPPLLKGRAS